MRKLTFAIIAGLLLTSASANARPHRGYYGHYGSGGTAAAANFQDQFKNTY